MSNIPVTVEETARLISRSSPENPVRFAFGPSGAALESRGQAWAMMLLIKWRGVAPQRNAEIEMSRQQAYAELVELVKHARDVQASGASPGDIYGRIFSRAISQRAIKLFDRLGVDFTWADPDASYEEDVAAFVNALSAQVSAISERS